MPGVPSPDNPLMPATPGWNYSNILPFAQRQQPAEPVQGTDESGRSQQFTAPRTAFALPDVIRASVNELTSAVTLPGRVAQGQVADTDLPRQAIAASLALVAPGAGRAAGAEALGVRHAFEQIEHDPFAVGGKELQFIPVDHDPFSVPSGVPPAQFTEEQLAKGREVPVSTTMPRRGMGTLSQNAQRQGQGADPILGLTDVIAEQKHGIAQVRTGVPKPTALAMRARAKAEEAIEKAEKAKRKKATSS